MLLCKQTWVYKNFSFILIGHMLLLYFLSIATSLKSSEGAQTWMVKFVDKTCVWLHEDKYWWVAPQPQMCLLLLLNDEANANDANAEELKTTVGSPLGAGCKKNRNHTKINLKTLDFKEKINMLIALFKNGLYLSSKFSLCTLFFVKTHFQSYLS